MNGYLDVDGAITLGDRRVLKPGRLRWLRAIGWMIGMFALVLLSVGPVMGLIRDLLPKGEAHIAFFANVTAGMLAITMYCLLVRFGEDRRPDELALKSAPIELAGGLALGAVMFGAVMAILMAADLYTVDWHGAAPAWRASGLAIQSAMIEEILVRGIVFRLLWRAFGPTVALAGSAALFGLGHVFNPGATAISTLCIALEAGVMLGALYALTGRLWVSIGVHAAWNFTQGYVFGAVVSGGTMGPALSTSLVRSDANVLLSGGSFGPEASLPALLVCSAVGVAALVAAWKSDRLRRHFGAAVT
ncbi:MAG TPA: type II CAAX endopeptidase family protein [Sphingomicrobium sp.]